MKIGLQNDHKARLLGSRAILIKHILRHWADAPSYAELHEMNKENQALWAGYAASDTFKVEIMLSEEHYSADGPHDNSAAIGILQVTRMTNIRLRRIWLGEKICDGQRSLVDKFDLKKRIYIGNTSMEAGLSLLMANQGLVRPGSMVNDPFTGTGSMLYAAAWFGAYVFGSDIDGRPMRGKEHSIHDSARQYGVSPKLLDCCST